MKECQNLDEVRAGIDALDRRIVELLSERSGYIEQAARIKNSAAEIEVPARVEEIVNNVRGLATEYGMSPDIAEDVYRVMVARFIEFEMQRYRETLP
ncbi:MAG TPA: chorismate mutase [Actinomycetota bacterium]|nr:chorismate mutase [Actinomycetota bacterium]